MRTLADLAREMRTAAAEVEEKASEVAWDVALTILAEVTVRTPADTSKAASNWQTRLSTPANSEIDAYFHGIGGSTAQSSVDAAYSAGLAVLEGKRPGEAIYISNVTDYISYLNDGSSYQAPAGFVERAVMVGRKKVEDSKVRLFKNGR